MEHDVTKLIREASSGHTNAFEELFALVYKDLRNRAANYLKQQRVGHTLQPTALVHEAFLRFSKHENLDLQDRAHFYSVAATAMRQILVDHARNRGRDKRGGGFERVPLEESISISREGTVDLVELDDALTRLAEEDERLARIVDLRFFGGMSVEDTARTLGIGTATVKRDWRLARMWLHRDLGSDRTTDPEQGS